MRLAGTAKPSNRPQRRPLPSGATAWVNGRSPLNAFTKFPHTVVGLNVPAEVGMVLPPETDFVLVAVNAGENVVNDPDAPEFDGHFADAATLILRQQ